MFALKFCFFCGKFYRPHEGCECPKLIQVAARTISPDGHLGAVTEDCG